MAPQFAIAGFLAGDEIRFIKQYTQGNGLVAWKYVASVSSPRMTCTSSLEPGVKARGKADSGCCLALPLHPHRSLLMRSLVIGESLHSSGSNLITDIHIYLFHTYREGTYAHANNPSQQDGPMSITIDTDDSKPYDPAGPFNLKGTGTDGIGNYDLIGTISADNDLDVEKTYYTSGGSWSWRYQGKFDGSGSINGIWREIRDDFAAAQGSFHRNKTQTLPRQTAQAFMPSAASYSVVPEPTVSIKISAAASKNPQVPLKRYRA